jgi:site-specific DNA recombinase
MSTSSGGESAKTDHRPALKAMLARIKEQRDVDYVVLWKVDRFARNRRDDANMLFEIELAGARLISVTENIDQTPAGRLMHGMLASFAEYYSRNLGNEVLKGLTEKAKRGGTPGRPPIGYLNVGEMVDGREIRTVAVDPARGPLIAETFRLYATGDYSLSELAAIMEARGLRSRPRRGRPAIALGTNRLSSLLRNDYYIGILRYAGKTSKGRHPKLTDEATFQQVREVLTAQRQSGERCWRHHSYLRGTLYCGECNGRLIYTRAKGRAGGIYEYFVCAGRQNGNCSQLHHLVQAVEQAVEDEYVHIELSEARREKIRHAVRAYVTALDGQAEPERQQVAEMLKRLAGQEKKLLQAHYQDHITPELFAEEQERIRRERVAAEQRQADLQIDHDQALEGLEIALSLTDRVQAAYLMAGPKARRLFNQAIFERIWIRRETVADVELASPFSDLLAEDMAQLAAERAPATADTGSEGASQGWTAKTLSMAAPAPNEQTPTTVFCRGGSNVDRMVRPSGLEPPRTKRSTRPSTLRVYQFRHERRAAEYIPALRPSTRPARVTNTCSSHSIVEPNRERSKHGSDQAPAGDIRLHTQVLGQVRLSADRARHRQSGRLGLVLDGARPPVEPREDRPAAARPDQAEGDRAVRSRGRRRGGQRARDGASGQPAARRLGGRRGPDPGRGER